MYCQAQAADELSSCMAVIRLLVLQSQLYILLVVLYVIYY